MQTRKIIICIDGTGNRVGDNESNILKLYKGLCQTDDQIVHYVPGVGTMSGPKLFDTGLRRDLNRLRGLAFGAGLEDDVLDAYRFLCRTYQSAEDKAAARSRHSKDLRASAKRLGLPRPSNPENPVEPENDQIYIFGFSRGAYAARILAGFIHNFGLVHPDRLQLIPQVFRAYRTVSEDNGMTQGKPEPSADVVFKALRQYHDVLSPNDRVPIRCLGLFDTVASLVRLRRPLASLWHQYSPFELAMHPNVVSNPSVRIFLHARAIDERRSLYRSLEWTTGPYYGNRFKTKSSKRTQFVHQRWFPGYHSDIGGSPRENFSGIGKITLLWMLRELEKMDRLASEEDARHAPGRRIDTPKNGVTLKGNYRSRVLEGRDQTSTTHTGEKYAQPDALAPLHDSMSLAWLPIEIFPKSIKRREWPDGRWTIWKWYLPMSEPRMILPDHTIDDSVFERMKRWRFYRPTNVTPHPDGPENRNPY